MLSRRSTRKNEHDCTADCLPKNHRDNSCTGPKEHPGFLRFRKNSPRLSSFLVALKNHLSCFHLNRRCPKYPYFYALLVICAFLAHVCVVRPISVVLFGPHGSLQGGLLGVSVDKCIREYHLWKTIRSWKEVLRKELGGSHGTTPLEDPPRLPSGGILKTRPNLAVGEMLLREKRRLEVIRRMSLKSDELQEKCLSEPNRIASIPRNILQMGGHLPTYWALNAGLDSVRIYDTDLNQLIRETHCVDFHADYPSFSPLCALYRFGGMLQNSLTAVNNHHSELEHIISLGPEMDGTCHSKIAYAIFLPSVLDSKQSSAENVSHVVLTAPFLAFPPKHPALKCLPHGAVSYDDFQYKFFERLKNAFQAEKQKTAWVVAKMDCSLEGSDKKEVEKCCTEASITVVNYIGAKHLEVASGHRLFFSLSSISPNEPSSSLTISVTEDNPSPIRLPSHKQSIQVSLMSRKWCEPGWLCNRCLKSPSYGQFSLCASVCGHCASNAICYESEVPKLEKIPIRVNVAGFDMSTSRRRIPRIIHQTWFEDLNPDRYPQLVRLQNSWRASGWDYRFYTDASARDYIVAKYPSRFVLVYDSLLPGAYKADFFRYLVLFKDGGVYADVDVMLNTNLDYFITPDLAFFVPRDAVGEHVEENYCVWNGLLGSAPGHPFLMRVIEWMLNLVLNRADIYDMERAICKVSGVNTESWKIRAEPGLLLSGPCALGVAINNALGNDSLSKFHTGILTPTVPSHHGRQRDTDFVGNVLILTADKRDLGEFRFSDPERNLIVASTEMPSLSKSPIHITNNFMSVLKKRETRPHYSRASKEKWLWGTRYIYENDLVSGEHVTLSLSFE